MGKLKERIQKRANYAARFELPYLDADQLEDLGRQASGLEGEALTAKRAEFIAEHCYLKLTVTRLATAEVGRAEEVAKRTLHALPADASDQDKVIAYGTYLAARRDHLWPVLLRHIEKAQERDGEGWIDAALPEAKVLLDDSGLVERGWLVSRYFDALEEDKKRAEADPNF